MSCPRCGGSMESGFTVDVGYGRTAVPKWVAGEPVSSIWSSGLKLRGKKRLAGEHLPLPAVRLPRELRELG